MLLSNGCSKQTLIEAWIFTQKSLKLGEGEGDLKAVLRTVYSIEKTCQRETFNSMTKTKSALDVIPPFHFTSFKVVTNMWGGPFDIWVHLNLGHPVDQDSKLYFEQNIPFSFHRELFVYKEWSSLFCNATVAFLTDLCHGYPGFPK